MQFFLVIPGVIWIKENVIVALVVLVGALSGAGVMGASVVAVYNYLSSVPNAITVLRAIQDDATLVTQKATYDIVVHAGIFAGFQGVNSYNGDYSGTGEIHAGVDLSEMSDDSVLYTDNHYEIQLPAPKFTTCVVSNFQLINRSPTVFNADWDQLFKLATIDAYYSLTEQGLQGKLLDLAENEAGEIVSKLVFNLTGKETVIHFTAEGRGSGSDERCEPAFPAGWGKEDIHYNWLRIE